MPCSFGLRAIPGHSSRKKAGALLLPATSAGSPRHTLYTHMQRVVCDARTRRACEGAFTQGGVNFQPPQEERGTVR